MSGILDAVGYLLVIVALFLPVFWLSGYLIWGILKIGFTQKQG